MTEMDGDRICWFVFGGEMSLGRMQEYDTVMDLHNRPIDLLSG